MEPYYSTQRVDIYHGDCLEVLRQLPAASVNCCVTSPPYWGLRDYGVEGQLGLERTPEEFVAPIVGVFREVRRVLTDDGTLWLNIGDSYNGSGPSGGDGKQYTNKGSQATTEKNVAGLKPKDLVGIPWMLAFALRADGWYLRQDIIWHKPNPMPESVRDRCTKAHEYVFLLSKSQRYYFDGDAIAEPAIESNDARPRMGQGPNTQYNQKRNGNKRPSVKRGEFNGKTEAMADSGRNAFRAVTDTRNKRSVWTVNPAAYAKAHFATFPPKLIEPMVLAGCPEGGTVLDPFIGSGTTAQVARELGRNCVGIELNEEYIGLIRDRLRQHLLI